MAKDSPTDHSLNNSLGHQGDKNTGGVNANHRVLLCTNVGLSTDYHELYEVVKTFGYVERIRMKVSPDKMSFNSYITFGCSSSANTACKSLKGFVLNGCKVSTKLFNVENINDDLYDFIPKALDPSVDTERVKRDPITLTWHIAAYKEGRENLIRASECLQRKIGNIPPENLKRYGRNILVKAGNDTQVMLLSNFKPPESGNIKSVTPHNSFNTLKGIIYSSDLYDFSEQEILERCPSYVYQVKKLNGINNSILLTFTSRFLPEYISFNHVRIKVKKFRMNPSQCHRCFEYGHVVAKCNNKKKCYVCSAEHDNWEHCESERYCFLCKGNHSPNSRECPRKLFEQEVVEKAHNEHISIGSAKRLILNANKNPQSSFASAIKAMNTQKKRPVVHKKPAPRNPPPPSPKRNDASDGSDIHETVALLLSDGAPIQGDTPPLEIKVNIPDCAGSSVEGTPQPSEKVPNSGPVNPEKADMESEIVYAPKVISRKDHKNSDGYIVPNDRKRARVTSPKKKDSGIATSNSFSLLEEIPLSKKQAVPKATAENSSNPVTSEPRGQRTSEPRGQRSRSAESSRSRKPDSKISKDLTSPKPIRDRSLSKMDTTTPNEQSDLDKAPSGSRKAPVLKENLKNPTRDIASQSKGEKTGKCDS